MSLEQAIFLDQQGQNKPQWTQKEEKGMNNKCGHTSITTVFSSVTEYLTGGKIEKLIEFTFSETLFHFCRENIVDSLYHGTRTQKEGILGREQGKVQEIPLVTYLLQTGHSSYCLLLHRTTNTGSRGKQDGASEHLDPLQHTLSLFFQFKNSTPIPSPAPPRLPKLSESHSALIVWKHSKAMTSSTKTMDIQPHNVKTCFLHPYNCLVP